MKMIGLRNALISASLIYILFSCLRTILYKNYVLHVPETQEKLCPYLFKLSKICYGPQSVRMICKKGINILKTLGFAQLASCVVNAQFLLPVCDSLRPNSKISLIYGQIFLTLYVIIIWSLGVFGIVNICGNSRNISFKNVWQLSVFNQYSYLVIVSITSIYSLW